MRLVCARADGEPRLVHALGVVFGGTCSTSTSRELERVVDLQFATAGAVVWLEALSVAHEPEPRPEVVWDELVTRTNQLDELCAVHDVDRLALLALATSLLVCLDGAGERAVLMEGTRVVCQ